MVMAQGILENTIKQIYNVDYTKYYMYTTKTCIYKYQNGDRKKIYGWKPRETSEIYNTEHN